MPEDGTLPFLRKRFSFLGLKKMPAPRDTVGQIFQIVIGSDRPTRIRSAIQAAALYNIGNGG